MKSIKSLESIKKVIFKFSESACILMIASLTLLSIISVILRYFFDIVFIQMEELITFLFSISIFLGCVPTIVLKENVSVYIFENSLHGLGRKLLYIFQYIVVILVQIIFVYASEKWISTNLKFNTPGLKIPFWTVYCIVPISAVLVCIIAFIDLIEVIVTPKNAEVFEKKEK